MNDSNIMICLLRRELVELRCSIVSQTEKNSVCQLIEGLNSLLLHGKIGTVESSLLCINLGVS